MDVAGRRIRLRGSRFRQLPQRVAPANPRDRTREVGHAAPSRSVTRGHQQELVKACVEDAAMRWGTGRGTGSI